MKKLLFIALILFAGNAMASSLPNCPSDPSVRWHNCFGTYTYSSGSKYVGEHKDNERHGQGTHTHANGDIYVGEFKDGERHGQGTNTWASGSKYVGEYKDNKRQGQGTYTWANGSKYVGEWKDNKRYGQGTLTFANGTKESGYYMNDEYVPTICENMGLTKGSDAFGQCVVELIKQIRDDD
jgi:hypothetical protein